MDAKLLTANRFVDTQTGISYRYIYSETEYFRPHYHDYYEIFILLGGKARHLVNGQDLLLKEGSIVFIRPNDIHDYLCVGGAPFSMLNFTFTDATARSLFDYLGEQAGAALQERELPPTNLFSKEDFSWLNAHMTAIRATSAADTEALKTALRVLLFRLVSKFFLGATESDRNRGEMPAWLSDLCLEMRKNENFVYGSARMFELSDRSREHVSRSLKKHTGMTVSEFVNDLRLTFVANMLKNSNHSISHILYESGFNNVSWASELFRKKYGMTMREYRKE